jgi:hypothetical protein
MAEIVLFGLVLLGGMYAMNNREESEHSREGFQSALSEFAPNLSNSRTPAWNSMDTSNRRSNRPDPVNVMIPEETNTQNAVQSHIAKLHQQGKIHPDQIFYDKYGNQYKLLNGKLVGWDSKLKQLRTHGNMLPDFRGNRTYHWSANQAEKRLNQFTGRDEAVKRKSEVSGGRAPRSRINRAEPGTVYSNTVYHDPERLQLSHKYNNSFPVKKKVTRSGWTADGSFSNQSRAPYMHFWDDEGMKYSTIDQLRGPHNPKVDKIFETDVTDRFKHQAGAGTATSAYSQTVTRRGVSEVNQFGLKFGGPNAGVSGSGGGHDGSLEGSSYSGHNTVGGPNAQGSHTVTGGIMGVSRRTVTPYQTNREREQHRRESGNRTGGAGQGANPIHRQTVTKVRSFKDQPKFLNSRDGFGYSGGMGGFGQRGVRVRGGADGRNQFQRWVSTPVQETSVRVEPIRVVKNPEQARPRNDFMDNIRSVKWRHVKRYDDAML